MKTDEELLAAYLDGVAELTPDERRRVEAALAESPELRDDADATRSLLGQLRAMPAEGNEPDWTAMQRAIRAEVGDQEPWWRGWRWLAPIAALALAGAVLALVLRPAAPTPITPVAVLPDAGVEPGAPSVQSDDDTVPLWLDGEDVEVDLAAEALLDDKELVPGDDSEVGLLPTTDLAWVDELGDDDIAAAEEWLARKKS